MHNFYIVMLPLAEEDIIRNVDYIAYEKQSPGTAFSLSTGFRKEIASLSSNPQRHEYDEDEELRALGVRKHYFKNYKIYYQISESENKVYILRVLHMLVDSKAMLLRALNSKKTDE